ncbi:VOC family protein [Thalassococcus sp. S3]|uniref:VOC family protein n=1 Tax=Thalassococcus sp. S3 TaxID=2017482 RepID=UPI001024282E|nr:VOC family protein [Thalassococcus sp. S3]QBF33661.1 glyoxalase [Thalassococcus sp. S3]
MSVGLDHMQMAVPEGAEDEARAFWCELVGLEEIEKPEALKARGGLWLQLDGAELHLGVEAPFHPAKKAHPGLKVAGIAALADAMEAKGYPVTWDDTIPGRKRFFCEDPFGNRLEFLEF